MSDFTDCVSEFIQKTDCRGVTKVCYKPAVESVDFMCMTCAKSFSFTFCEDCVQVYRDPAVKVTNTNDNHAGGCENERLMIVWSESILPYTA